MARASVIQLSIASFAGALFLAASAYAPKTAFAAPTLGGGGPSVNPTLAPTVTQPIAPAAPPNAAAPVPSPSGTPSGPTYTSFTGTWEVAMQTGRTTAYTHFFFEDGDGTTLRGRWLREKNLTPITGALEGDRFRLTGEDAKGAFTMTGYEEGTATMVGLFTQGAARTPFTAVHRGESTQPGVKLRHPKHGKTHKVEGPAPAAVPQGQLPAPGAVPPGGLPATR